MSSSEMRFIDHGKGGAAEVLQMASMPRPQPRANEVLIEVAYAGVNRPDVAQRAGLYPPPTDASPVLGLEVAGTVVAIGSDVARWQPGDAVCALTAGGGYAEYAVAPAAHCLPIPEGWSLRDAAALPENWFTVWATVAQQGRLARGETLLVHGGSSGIGVAAIQLGKLLGARVVTTVGNAAKQAFCRELGADFAINYRDGDFAAAVRRDVETVDVILDMVGGDYLSKNIGLLAFDGRLVQIATLGGSKATLELAQVLMKRLLITGSTMRRRSHDEKAVIARELEATIWPALADGRIKSVVHAEFPLAAAADAHRLMESSQHMGKIVLKVKQDH